MLRKFLTTFPANRCGIEFETKGGVLRVGDTFYWYDVRYGNAATYATNFVLNPSFEADRISVSVPVGWKSTSGPNLEQGHTGRWSWQLSSNGTLQQQITAIPDGTYTLSVWARAAGAGAQLTAKGCGGADSTTPIPAGSAFASVESAPIAIQGGNCTVGVVAGGGVTIDDFSLTDE
jgi:hypothetical protein